jgi:general secretion pathway protein A
LSSSGFVVIDAGFKPVYANPESIKILGYPNACAATNPDLLDGILTQKILSFLPREFRFSKNACALQFRSGRRAYYCRAFIVEDHWSGGRQESRIALLLERGLPGPPSGVRRNRVFAGMHEDPFSFISNPRYYHFSRAHQEIYTSLRNLVLERRGIGVLFAQSGMGKTALINYLHENLRDKSEIAIFPGSFESRAELVRSVMAILGVEGVRRDLRENLALFEKWLLSKNRDGRSVLLICDEAQDLDPETLDSLFLFSKFQTSQQKLLQILLSGRQELLQKLTESGRGLNGEMVNIFCRLTPLDEAEAASYVLHRLRIAGCNRQLFDSAALSSIALYSRGIPLNINMICRHCLSLAASINLRVIDERMVADSAYDLVLRTQPVGAWDDLDSYSGADSRQPSGRQRNRRGLKLVQ